MSEKLHLQSGLPYCISSWEDSSTTPSPPPHSQAFRGPDSDTQFTTAQPKCTSRESDVRPAGPQPAYSITAWKTAMAWNAYIHPQKASLFYSEPPQPPLASRLCVGTETSHRREQKGVQLPSQPGGGEI